MQPELSQKLKNLDKLLLETEKVAKKYLALTGKCSTALDEEDKVVIPFDEALYTKLQKVYQEASAIFTKDEAAIDACLEKVAELQKTAMASGPPSGYGGKGVSNHNSTSNQYGGVSAINSLNPGAFSPGMILGNAGNINPNALAGGANATKLAGEKRKFKDPESPVKKQKRVPKKGLPQGPSSPMPSTFVGSVGDLAAARAPNSDQWILVRITGYNPKTARYEVEDDAPDEEEPIAKKFACTQDNVVLLPPDYSAIPATANQPPNSVGTFGPVVYLWYPIPAKAPVLAMFPQTTTFYPAKVISSHKQQKNKLVQYYQLQFDDDNEGGATPTRKVNAQYVIPLPNSLL